MADRTRSRAKPASGEPKPVKVLLVLGEYDNVLNPESEYAQSQVNRQYDTVNIVDPDGDLSPRNIKRVSNQPVVFDVLDLRQPRVSVTAAWDIVLAAEHGDDDGGVMRSEYRCACDEAVQAIAVALSLAKRDNPELAWRVQSLRRMGEIGKL